jgi:fatty-acyl-CoA synthase
MNASAGEAPKRPPSSQEAWLRALERTQRIAKEPSRTLAMAIEELAATAGDALALIGETQTLTYRGLAQASNRYARWALAQGIGLGDCVGLLMPNRPEYVAIWLGITRIGGTVALINTSLRGAALAHSFNIVRPRHVVVDGTLLADYEAARPLIAGAVHAWVYGGAAGGGVDRLEEHLSGYGAEPIGALAQLPRLQDRALHIYTSGTTGWPKAANVSHHRIMLWSHWFAGMMDVRPNDRMYDCLPMYHSIGGIVAIGAMLVGGGSVLLRERFSAARFWGDIVEGDCTLFQYIGELCRYLVNSAPDPREARHRLRLCCGNGLRGDIWEQFSSRFKIPQILEFYAATENNFSLFNCDGKVGAIGRIPSFLAHRFNVALVKLDEEGLAPARDASGFCTRCAPGEPGEAIGEIRSSEDHRSSRFEGYTDEAASQKKVMRDVFAKGDAWLRTGDVMRQDAKGYFYFVDRIGDTFRWKGENVATSEVCDAILTFPGTIEAAVYGVAVPGTEGRAGMAAIVTREGFDLAGFRQHLIARLPSYARPLFVRVCSALSLTATFKHSTKDLLSAGFDPAMTGDAIYFDDRNLGAFVRMEAGLFHRIQARQLRL